jgi:hypothetical protein
MLYADHIKGSASAAQPYNVDVGGTLIRGAHQALQPGKTQPKKFGSWLEWLDAKRPPSFQPLQPLQPTPKFFGLCFSWLEVAGGLGVPYVSIRREHG